MQRTVGEASPTTTRLLFVCTANRCRSPIAERLLRARACPAVTAASAGLAASPGEPMVAESAAVLRELGGDDAGFGSRRVAPDVVADADLVLTMTVGQRDELLGRFPRLLRRTFTLGEAATLAAGSESSPAAGSPAEVLAAARAARAGSPIGDVDVPDPVGLPAEVHRHVAAQIAGYLDALLPVLCRSVPEAPPATDPRS